MSGRNAQISRIYSILNLLEGSPQGLSVSEITERMIDRNHKASKRTIYRDLEALAGAGFPLFPVDDGTASKSTSTRWVLEKNARIDKYLVLNPRELVGLYLARSVLTPFKGSPFFNDLNQMFEKIEDKIGSRAKAHLREISEEIKFDPTPQFGLGVVPEILENVRLACTEGHLLEVLYKSDKVPRKLGPHFIYFSKGSLYLIADDLSDTLSDSQIKTTQIKTKTFALARIQNAQMLEQAFKGAKVEPETYFKNSFGVFSNPNKQNVPIDVVILFASNIAPFIKERVWHSTQSISELSDGTVELKVNIKPTPDFLHWVLGFGPNAKILQPAHLQNEIVALLEQTKTLYKIQTITQTSKKAA